MSLYSPSDYNRITSGSGPSTQNTSPYRTEFRKDYARLIHSAAFRRLQGKTQLYPSHENDYFRTRLTHSIEVAQIAKDIALLLNSKHSLEIDPDIVEFAGLAHDLGHPPFGHQGEEALDECMINHGGFEGNAQTLRILARLEKKLQTENFKGDQDMRIGLDLTYRTLASIIKYDNIIPYCYDGRDEYAKSKGHKEIEPVKGYYESENDIVNFVKENVLDGYHLRETITSNGQKEIEKFKTIECKIMDIADDIAYSTYDLDDTLKANFSNPFDIIFPNESILKSISDKTTKIFGRTVDIDEVKNVLFGIFKEIFEFDKSSEYEKLIIDGVSPDNLFESLRYFYETRINAGKALAQDGYLRNQFTSKLIDQFVNSVQFTEHEGKLLLSDVSLKDDIKLKVEVLKTFNYEVNIQSSRLKIPAYRGKQIVKNIFEILTEDKSHMLLPNDFKEVYLSCNSNRNRFRTICDFIAGMTDKYCIEFYARLTSENAETIFKPI